jgi:hypothetical protein
MARNAWPSIAKAAAWEFTDELNITIHTVPTFIRRMPEGSR